MSFNFDDNLIENKRKNTNPARTTNILIISGFVTISILLVLLLAPSTSESSNIPVDIDATVNARVNEYIQQQSSSSNNNSKSVVDTEPVVPQPALPTIQPRPLIEGTTLEANRMVEDTITSDKFEIHYTYEGKANTAILITMQGISLDSPAVVLTNPYGEKIIASATANQPIGDSDTHVIGAVLPTDGQYVITATRENGRAGDSEGDFQLSLDMPSILSSESRVTGTVQSNMWQWYIYQSDNPFSVSYAQASDTYHPEVGVYVLNARSEFDNVGYILGDGVTYGTLGRFEADETYFIAVGQSTLQYNQSSPITAGSYTLGIQIAR